MTDVLHRPPGRTEPAPLSAPETPVALKAPLYDTAAALLRHPRVMVVDPALLFVLAVTMAYLGRDYTARSRITPQGQESNVSSLTGVAAQMGLMVPSGHQNESVDFYADLLKSREILDSLALTTYHFPIGKDEQDTLTGTYIDLYHIKGRTPYDLVYRARRRLERKVTVTVKRSSAIVTVQTNAKWGRMAEQMNRRLLDLVNEFNLQRRQTQASAERQFLEQRLKELRTELADAQGAVRSFLERNRVWESDPALNVEMQNRNRRVTELEQAYGAVIQRYEDARAEEVRNTPLITIVEAPESSRRRSGGLLLNGLLGLVAGTNLAAGLALALEYAAVERSRHPEAYESFRRLLAGVPRRIFRGRGR